MEKRKNMRLGDEIIPPKNQVINTQTAEYFWNLFYDERKETGDKDE